MLEKNKQAWRFNFEEDPSYFVILLYKLCNFIKMYDCYVNDPIKGIFRRLCCYFISARKVSWNINGFGCIQHVKAC